MGKLFLYFAIIIVIIGLDQWSKTYVASHFYLGESVEVIDGFFNLKYVHNKGAAFGFGNDYGQWPRIILFKILPVIACFWLLSLLWHSLRGPKLMSFAYAFVLGGAIGNIIDRIRLDYVVDFFDFYIKTGQNKLGMAQYKHFATFNISDSFITIAAFLIIIDFFKERKRKLREESEELSSQQIVSKN
ncbi:MAG: signal peptidase II [Halobacteriovoraceae bacterium]|nr:signal peptidase II [Halobacteriovoraceae bacterium]|tara:strand:- start:4953 stop:5513 length:561 start_codon:yes stop_codon:yes gene_type:complete